jgi:protein TonB
MNPFPLSRGTLIAVLSVVAGVIVTTTAHAATEPAVPVRMVAPIYPYELKREGITGIVSVSFEVDEQGNVQDAAVQKSSNSKFDQAALEAIKKWKFKPGRKDGVPVKMKVAIPLQFNVNE